MRGKKNGESRQTQLNGRLQPEVNCSITTRRRLPEKITRIRIRIVIPDNVEGTLSGASEDEVVTVTDADYWVSLESRERKY